jgi:ribosomal protein L11 methyltransferase
VTGPAEHLSLYNIRLTMPADLLDEQIGSIASGLSDVALATSTLREGNEHRGKWVITWLVDFAPDAREIVLRLPPVFAVRPEQLVVEDVPQVNWLEHSYQQFKPFSVGAFFIYGSHYNGAVPANLQGLQIDAATAFGSGEHGTTAGCLRALLSLQENGEHPRKVLDMGTGSGILAIAAARLWGSPVLAADIDEESVRVAKHHAQINKVEKLVTCLRSDGFTAAAIRDSSPFDIVLANILAGPLIIMAADIARATAPGGHAVVSGLLTDQAEDVMAAYAAQGMALQKRYDENDWVALLLRKPD